MPRDEFKALLSEQLEMVGNTIWRHHLQTTEALRSELAEVRRRLEEKDPGLWQVPEDPAPCKTTAQGAPLLPLAARPSRWQLEASNDDYELVCLYQDGGVPGRPAVDKAALFNNEPQHLDRQLQGHPEDAASSHPSRGAGAADGAGQGWSPHSTCLTSESFAKGPFPDMQSGRQPDALIDLKAQGSASLPRRASKGDSRAHEARLVPCADTSDIGASTGDAAMHPSGKQVCADAAPGGSPGREEVGHHAGGGTGAGAAPFTVLLCQQCGQATPPNLDYQPLTPESPHRQPLYSDDATPYPETPAGPSPGCVTVVPSRRCRKGLILTRYDSLPPDHAQGGSAGSYTPCESPNSTPTYFERRQSIRERTLTPTNFERRQSTRERTLDEVKEMTQEELPACTSQSVTSEYVRTVTFASEASPSDHLKGKCEVQEIHTQSEGTPGAGKSPFGAVATIRFVARDVWSKGGKSGRHPTGALKSFRGGFNVLGHHTEEAVRLPRRRWVSRVMLRPTSKVLTCWSMACFVFLCYDIVVVPIRVVFDLPENPWIRKVELVSILFWMCDIVLNLLTGVQRNEFLEMRPWPVAVNYLSGWLPVDVAIVASEWAVFYLKGLASLAAISMIRVLRVFRLLRIIRLARFSRVFNDFMLFMPEPILLCMGFLKAISFFAVLLHLLACTWYWVGVPGSLGRALGDALAEQDPTVIHKYVYTVRLSVAQLHGTSILPLRTVGELLLAAFCGVLGFIVLAICVSETAQALESTEEKHKVHMHRLCRHYLRSRNVSAELKTRLRKYLGESDIANGLLRLDFMPRSYGNLNPREKVQHEDRMVQELPPVLQADLYEEVRRPLMETQKLYRDLGMIGRGSPVMRELCHKAICCEVALIEELVFTMGDVCNKSLIVETGELMYVHGILHDEAVGGVATSVYTGRTSDGESVDSTDTGADSDDEEVAVKVAVGRGKQISEAVLWTKWRHCGALVAQADCIMLALDAGQFARVVGHHDAVLFKARKYVSHVLAWMNTLDDQNAFSDLLEIPDDIVCEQILSRHMNPREHLIFISHFKKEAGTEATLLEEGFQNFIRLDPLHPANDFRRPVFLDSQDLVDLKSVERYVRRSHNIVILLTPNVLTRPYCLLEILTALKYGVEIVPVKVLRAGLSFSLPDDAFWQDLTGGRVLQPEEESLLKSRGVELHQLKDVRKVFDKIALPYSPHGTLKVREAELKDILARCVVREKCVSTPRKLTHSTSSFIRGVQNQQPRLTQRSQTS